jgi:hypothetical protein
MKSLVDLCLDFHRKNRPTVLNDDYVMKSILMYKYSKNGTIDWFDHTLNTINEEILEILLNYPYKVVEINDLKHKSGANLLSEDVKNILNNKKINVWNKLKFWFNNDVELSIPEVYLQYHQVHINLNI